jgi:hypothetical protein
LKAIGIANAVNEQVNQNKENQQILAQATVEANDKIEQLEKQQAQLYAALTGFRLWRQYWRQLLGSLF